MRYIQSLALLLVTGLLVSCSPQNQSVDLVRTAIVNTTVIDVVNGVRQNQTIVFEGDEIVAVGPTATISSPSKTIV